MPPTELALTISRTPVTADAPLSFAQPLWFLDQLIPDSDIYNEAAAV